ncbi:MAG TPA: methanogen output domain 1-containing protein [Roseiflexaceae bacterium]|nr:methanogen output domain 1-containing protein [Roseiflexaceae bacterium]HMP40840.1 methanogen output domain 1-containing protein [Roseiflexaceae bacterium]
MTQHAITDVEIPLERDQFMRSLISHLAATLEDVIGVGDATGFISLVGRRMGDEINRDYCRALALSQLSRPDVTQVLIDLKRRIKGDFYVIEETDDTIVLGNRACPFGTFVTGRETLCMMTSNVFGVIAAENLGYAKVVLEETIARGASNCRVVIHLRPSNEAEAANGREYFKSRA